VDSLNLPRVSIPPRTLDGVVPNIGKIDQVTYFELDVHGLQHKRVFAYVVLDQEDDMILGDPWLKDVKGVYSAQRGRLDVFTRQGERIRCWNRAEAYTARTKKIQIRKATAG
jgi:hypothetical protein